MWYMDALFRFSAGDVAVASAAGVFDVGMLHGRDPASNVRRAQQGVVFAWT
jgi:hypothetical protein